MFGTSKLPFYVALLAVGFAVNLIWELSQMQFYAEKPGSSFADGVLYCSLASVIDAVSILMIYSIAKGFFNPKSFRFYFLASAIGALLSIIFESFAFYFRIWSYRQTMPIVPLLEIGLLPFVQLIALVPFSIAVVSFYFRRIDD